MKILSTDMISNIYKYLENKRNKGYSEIWKTTRFFYENTVCKITTHNQQHQKAKANDRVPL